ncbi:unnamed protein product [Cyprideis torosa]|uniref:Uncharacterized protein n=1 Tax=Cyprideis torosa TaxID=163714 RepID=A0A7R8ZPC0_9CRUS|nr:unnamed protein product [Cyprideis torosa]CAG0898469.1 unnamed protein product [Cyprideis torosa]
MDVRSQGRMPAMRKEEAAMTWDPTPWCLPLLHSSAIGALQDEFPEAFLEVVTRALLLRRHERATFSLTMEDQYGLSAKGIGYVTSAQSIFSAGSSFLSGPVSRFYASPVHQLFYVTLLYSLTIAGLTYAPTWEVMLIFLMLYSILNSLLRVSGAEVTTLKTPPEHLGTVTGVGQTVSSLARMAAPMVAGFATSFSVNGPGLSSMLFAVVSVLISYPMLKDSGRYLQLKRKSSGLETREGHLKTDVTVRVMASILGTTVQQGTGLKDLNSSPLVFTEVIAEAAAMVAVIAIIQVIKQVPAVLNALKGLCETLGIIEGELSSIKKSQAEIKKSLAEIDKSLKDLKAKISESTLISVRQHLATYLNVIDSAIHPPEGRDLREHIREAYGNKLHEAVRGLYNNVVRTFGGPSVLDLGFDIYKDEERKNVDERLLKEIAEDRADALIGEQWHSEIPNETFDIVRILRNIFLPTFDFVPTTDAFWMTPGRRKDYKIALLQTIWTLKHTMHEKWNEMLQGLDFSQVERKVTPEIALIFSYIILGIWAHALVNEGQSPLDQEELNTLTDEMNEMIQKARDTDRKWKEDLCGKICETFRETFPSLPGLRLESIAQNSRSVEPSPALRRWWTLIERSSHDDILNAMQVVSRWGRTGVFITASAVEVKVVFEREKRNGRFSSVGWHGSCRRHAETVNLLARSQRFTGDVTSAATGSPESGALEQDSTMLAELRLFLEVVGKAARTAKRDDCLRVVEESSDVLNIVEKLLETAGLIESTLESIDQSLKAQGPDI